MRTRLVPALAALVVVTATAMVIASRVQTEDRSDAVHPGLQIRPGTYKAEWIIPKPKSQSHDNPRAGRVEFSSPDLGGKTPLPQIQGTLILWNDSNKIPFTLDATGRNYDILHIDANRNGNPGDDPAAKGVSRSEYSEGRFPGCAFISAARMPINKLIPGASGENVMELDLYVSQFPSHISEIDVRARGCWAGKADSNKGPIPFLILDYNMNGRYSDAWEMIGNGRRGGDMVVFDWSGKGDFRNPFGEYPKQRATSSPANIFGELLELKPSESGDQLVVSKYGGPSGQIEIKGGKIGKTQVKAASLRFCRLIGHTQTYVMPDDGTPLEVPAGEYYLTDAEAVPAGTGGFPNWSLRYVPDDPLGVEDGKTITVSLSGDLKMLVWPKEETITVKKGKSAGIHVALVLADKGVVTIDEEKGSPKRGTSYMLPTMQMRDSAGRIVYRGRVDWNRPYTGILGDQSALPQTLKPGKYTYEIEYDTGPFGGVMKARKAVVVK